MAVPEPSSSGTTVYSSSAESYLANANGTSVRRIRTPHPHDVLSGRGGGINGHPGNVAFRAWVAERKNDYNLALNKADKAAVARQVVAMVREQSPPGRFLTKDPSAAGGGAGMVTMTMGGLGGWWVELDEERTMAKTAQALREGAPAIRAEHADELLEMKREVVEHRRHRHREHKHSKPPQDVEEEALRLRNGSEDERIVDSHMRSGEEGDAYEEAPDALGQLPPPPKRVRVEYNGSVVRPTDATPPLLPSEPMLSLADLPPLDDHRVFPLPPPPLPKRPSAETNDNLKRAHSLAFSEDTSLGEWAQDDFVNPFGGDGEDEMARLEAIRNGSINNNPMFSRSPPSRTGFSSSAVRDTSTTSSHGDMGGISALLQGNVSGNSNNNSNSGTGLVNHRAGSSSVRSRTSLGNASSRYELLDDGFDDDAENDGISDFGSSEDFAALEVDDWRDLLRGADPSTWLSDDGADHPDVPSSSQSYLQWWELPVVPRPVSPFEV